MTADRKRSLVSFQACKSCHRSSQLADLNLHSDADGGANTAGRVSRHLRERWQGKGSSVHLSLPRHVKPCTDFKESLTEMFSAVSGSQR